MSGLYLYVFAGFMTAAVDPYSPVPVDVVQPTASRCFVLMSSDAKTPGLAAAVCTYLPTFVRALLVSLLLPVCHSLFTIMHPHRLSTKASAQLEPRDPYCSQHVSVHTKAQMEL